MRTLLLADDSVTTQRVVALTFSDESFRVVTVSDGQQAIDSMAAARPDIVLAGTTLPRTNGYELAEYMRSVVTLKDVPVLLLSGAFESVDSARLTASGARGVIEKPLEPTAVISRVKELLGLKDTRPAPPVGRLVTAADSPPERQAPRANAAPPPPVRKAPAAAWDDLRHDTGLEPDAKSVEGGGPGSGREDYFDSLDAAFDSLDQQLAGRHPDTNPKHRNPSPPLGQASGAADPRSPGRRPPQTSEAPPANSVFEVDSDWFADDQRKSNDLAAEQDMIAGANDAMPARPAASPANPIFEVDDEWFAQDDKAREEARTRQQELAAEMGIHDVELPEAEPAINAAAPPEGLDFDFGLDDLGPRGQARHQPAPDSPFAPPAQAPAPVAQAPEPVAPAPVHEAPLAPPAPLAPRAPQALLAPLAPSSMADDFAALLAFETGDPIPHPEPLPAPPAATVQTVTPDITDAMLDQIAQRVADRLNAGAFGADLRQAMTTTIRDTVRSVVSDTSERLVRDEIARVKARVERDTH